MSEGRGILPSVSSRRYSEVAYFGSTRSCPDNKEKGTYTCIHNSVFYFGCALKIVQTDIFLLLDIGPIYGR